MKFNIEDYDETYVMHCKSSNEADIFAEYLDSQGYTWSSGNSYVGRTFWSPVGGGTCYRFKRGFRGFLESYLQDVMSENLGFNAKVLEFDDFEWGIECDKDHPPSIEFISFDQAMGYSPI